MYTHVSPKMVLSESFELLGVVVLLPELGVGAPPPPPPPFDGVWFCFNVKNVNQACEHEKQNDTYLRILISIV